VFLNPASMKRERESERGRARERESERASERGVRSKAVAQWTTEALIKAFEAWIEYIARGAAAGAGAGRSEEEGARAGGGF